MGVLFLLQLMGLLNHSVFVFGGVLDNLLFLSHTSIHTQVCSQDTGLHRNNLALLSFTNLRAGRLPGGAQMHTYTQTHTNTEAHRGSQAFDIHIPGTRS